MELARKTAIVTGAGVRLGKAMALAMAERGARLVVHYNRSAGPAQEVVGQIEALGSEALAVQADLSQPRQAPSIVGFLSGLRGAPEALGVWIDPRAARQLAEQTARALEAVPIVGEREASRWWALTVVLEPFRRGGWLTVAVSERPPAVRLKLALTRDATTPAD